MALVITTGSSFCMIETRLIEVLGLRLVILAVFFQSG